MENYFSSRKGKGAGNGEYKQKQATRIHVSCSFLVQAAVLLTENYCSELYQKLAE